MPLACVRSAVGSVTLMLLLRKLLLGAEAESGFEVG